MWDAQGSCASHPQGVAQIVGAIPGFTRETRVKAGQKGISPREWKRGRHSSSLALALVFLVYAQ